MLLDELKRYKTTLINKIISSGTLVSLIDNSYSVHPSKLVNRYVFPYPHVIDTVTDEATYVTMKVSVPKVYNKTYKGFSIYIYIFSHEKLMQTTNGLRTDLIAEEMERLLNGSLDFGLGRLELTSVEDFSPAPKFYGIIMRYEASDFNR